MDSMVEGEAPFIIDRRELYRIEIHYQALQTNSIGFKLIYFRSLNGSVEDAS